MLPRSLGRTPEEGTEVLGCLILDKINSPLGPIGEESPEPKPRSGKVHSFWGDKCHCPQPHTSRRKSAVKGA